jgi:hypothetical protein
METPTPELDRHDHVLLGLVMNVQATAMVQMGKMTDPTAGGIQRDLGAARVSIDILEALQAKTKGNLVPDVAALLDRAVMELQLNYTDEAKREEAAADEPADETPAQDDAPEAPGGSDDAEA